MTLEQLEKATGYNTGNLSRLERGMVGYSGESLNAIAKALGVQVSEFFVQDGAKASDEMVGNIIRAPVYRGQVPLVPWSMAGKWGEVTSETMIPTEKRIDEGMALLVGGDAMVSSEGGDTFPAGTIIIIERIKAVAGDYVLARRNSVTDPMFRQFIEDGGRYLKPLNSRYPMVEIEADGEVLGVMVEAVWRRMYK